MIAIFMVSQSICKLNLGSIFSPFQQNRKLKGRKYTFKANLDTSLFPQILRKAYCNTSKSCNIIKAMLEKQQHTVHCFLISGGKKIANDVNSSIVWVALHQA